MHTGRGNARIRKGEVAGGEKSRTIATTAKPWEGKEIVWTAARRLCHNSEAVDAHGASLRLEPGQDFDFKIIKMNPDEKKVGLSIRAVGEEGSRQDVEAYKHPASSATATIGDLVEWKRAGNDQN